MRKFICLIIVYVFALTVIYASLFYAFRTTSINRMNTFDCVILGTSHIKNVRIPNSINLAENGSTIINDYYKLKSISSILPGKTIILGIDHLTFSPRWQYKFKTNFENYKYYKSKRIARYYLVPDYSILSNEFIDINLFFHLSYDKLDYWINLCSEKTVYTDYNWSNDTLRINKLIDDHQTNSRYAHTKDRIQSDYLNKIIELCANNNAKLYFLVLPESRYYKNHLNSHTTSQFDHFLIKNNSKIIQSKHEFDMTYFFDGFHLNKKGIIYFNDFLKSELENEVYK